jgi:hypothetical protein
VGEKQGHRKKWKGRNKMDDKFKKYILKERRIIKESVREKNLITMK